MRKKEVKEGHKKISSDKSFCEQVKVHVRAHTETEFSHGRDPRRWGKGVERSG